jgi:hypothetical protein
MDEELHGCMIRMKTYIFNSTETFSKKINASWETTYPSLQFIRDEIINGLINIEATFVKVNQNAE